MPVNNDLATRLSRIGFAGLHLAGPGGWGQPEDRAASIDLLRTAVESGVTYVDTADVLGPDVSEQVIAEALAPYSANVVVATKVGMTRAAPRDWGVIGRPSYLKQQVYSSAFRLRLDSIPLVFLHRVDPSVPLEDQLGALADLKTEGVVEHIGLSAVGVPTIRRAQEITPIAAVQNPMNPLDRASDEVLAHCNDQGISFIAFWCFGRGRAVLDHPILVENATKLGVTSAQLALAWLLQRSPNLIAIPGTGSQTHLRSNLDALTLELPDSVTTSIDSLWDKLNFVPEFPLD